MLVCNNRGLSFGIAFYLYHFCLIHSDVRISRRIGKSRNGVLILMWLWIRSPLLKAVFQGLRAYLWQYQTDQDKKMRDRWTDI